MSVAKYIAPDGSIIPFGLGQQGGTGAKGDKGDKGDPGGWVDVTILPANANLDDAVAPGLYRSGTATEVHTSLPPDFLSGSDGYWLEVVSYGNGSVYALQRLHSLKWASPNDWGLTNLVWERAKYGVGVWKPWRKLLTPGGVGGADIPGVGSPQGVIAAKPGSYYTDIAGTNGAWRWIKKAGTGNTGWEVVLGDTGWRDISEGLHTGNWKLNPSAPRFRLRRVNNDVMLRARLQRADAAPSQTLDTPQHIFADPNYLPDPFRHSDYGVALGGLIAYTHMAILSFEASTSNPTLRGSVATSVYSPGGTVVTIEARWMNDRPWPTSLPGTPA